MDRRNKKNSITWNGDASEWFVEAITHIEIKKVVKWHNREKSFGHFGDADVRMTKLVEAINGYSLVEAENFLPFPTGLSQRLCKPSN